MDAITHDKALDVATGISRKTKVWKNKPMQWSALLDRMEKVTRTAETMAEYKNMGREQQSEIKDVGGFVGGYCNNGNRSDIRHRSILCLDADFATTSLWDDWSLLFGNAGAVYSTHKHTPEKPRLRLVVPLSRNVTPEEYQAIGRKVAATLGIDQFDDTSYQPQRMMYWPSASQDAEYVFQYTDGDFLDADAILAQYHNWRDVSSWPMSSRVSEVIKKTADKQKDPLEKPGLVGAFCRAYSIEEAIAEFVPTYQPSDGSRYTYTEGSTASGVVTYDGKFSYSHHATDPASMQLCNAWDLVRLHKFGALDEDADPTKPVSSRPSYKAMADLATADERVKVQIVADRMAESKDAFAEEEIPTADKNWRGKLDFTKEGGIRSTIGNVVTILNGDPSFIGRIAFNEMSHDVVALGSLPWRKSKGERLWSDADDANLRYYIERVYGLSGKEKIFDAVNVVAQAHKFHPVRDYLDSCTWDGEPRLETLLVDYLGAEDSPYTRAVTRKTLVAAVARIYEPGCKFDHMLTLRGRQGIGKSAVAAKLGGQWFSDSLTTVQGKEACEQVQGVWIMEIGELAGMKKAEVEAIKQFLTKNRDRFRPAYGKRTLDSPRQCIFIGTTNETQFLRDTTGNRRFWVVDTPNKPRLDMWSELTPEMVSLIWGEAIHFYKKGEKLFLPKDLEAVAREVQELYEEENPKVGIVAQYLERLLPEDWADKDSYSRRAWLESGELGTVPRETVCTMELWVEALGQNPDRFDRYASKEVRDIMEKIPEWRHQGNAIKTIKPYGRQRYYKKEE